MIKVSPRARRHEDCAGDPLDGLVNLFDLGIVLSVAFLLAALSSLNLEQAITDTGLTRPKDQITVPDDSQVDEVPTDGKKVVGRGKEVGTVYRLDDGRLIYVVPSESPSASASPDQ